MLPVPNSLRTAVLLVLNFPESPVSFIAKCILMYLIRLQFPSVAGALPKVTFGSISSAKQVLEIIIVSDNDGGLVTCNRHPKLQ